jgi:hypothetical protein
LIHLNILISNLLYHIAQEMDQKLLFHRHILKIKLMIILIRIYWITPDLQVILVREVLGLLLLLKEAVMIFYKINVAFKELTMKQPIIQVKQKL